MSLTIAVTISGDADAVEAAMDGVSFDRNVLPEDTQVVLTLQSTKRGPLNPITDDILEDN